MGHPALGPARSPRAIVPTGAQGTSEIIIDLMSLDGRVLAETKTSLVIPVANQPPPAAASASAPRPVPLPASPQVGSAALASPAQAATPNPGDRERALSLYSKGLELLERGDVDAARKFFERAADLGLSQGAMALATSHDPNELAKLKVIGLQANAATARKWYDRAAELGAAEAGERLHRLGARVSRSGPLRVQQLWCCLACGFGEPNCLLRLAGRGGVLPPGGRPAHRRCRAGKARTATTKIAPWITNTHSPKPAR